MSNIENIELPGALDFTFVCALSINLTMCSQKYNGDSLEKAVLEVHAHRR